MCECVQRYLLPTPGRQLILTQTSSSPTSSYSSIVSFFAIRVCDFCAGFCHDFCQFEIEYVAGENLLIEPYIRIQLQRNDETTSKYFFDQI